MRAVLLVAVVCVVAVAGVSVGRPVALHNKLAHRRAQLGESQTTQQLESLRVAAEERVGGSLADQFASDLEAHVVAKDALKAALKADTEAVAGLSVVADSEATTEAEIVADAEAVQEMDMDVAQAVEMEAEAEEDAEADSEEDAEADEDAEAAEEGAGAADQGLSIEALQELEYAQEQTQGAAAEQEKDKKEKAKKSKGVKASGAKKDKKKVKSAKKGDGKKDGKKKGDKKKSAAAGKKDAKKPKDTKKESKKPKDKVKAKDAKPKKDVPPAAPKKREVPKVHTLKDGTKWSNCLAAGDKDAKGAGQTKLTAISFKAAPPLRESSYVVEIDGQYTGPDVTYGSVTLQIARVKTHPEEVEVKGVQDPQELVYRHSVVLQDVLMYNPFTAKDPLSATMYIPDAAFNRYAKAGDYAMTVVFTNQDKQPFACAKLEFNLA